MSRSFSCSCGMVIEASGLDELVGLVKDHFDEAHPEYGLGETSIRNYLEAEDRLTGPADRLAELGEVEIHPISPRLVDDIVEFFDHRAVVGNPAWAGCYCMFYFMGGHDNPGWGERPWRDNRSALVERISVGGVSGVVAYVDGTLAGWCNATARSEFPSLRSGTDEGLASVVCFAIAPPYRGHGLAAKLLGGAIEELRRRGFRRVEGYPAATPDEDPERGFRGWPELFQAAGFRPRPDDPAVVARDV